MGISERKEGTIQALFSPRLWTENGLLTQAGDSTFWDRSTLYALRGVYAVGETEKATEYLKHYSSVRLLGEHVSATFPPKVLSTAASLRKGSSASAPPD